MSKGPSREELLALVAELRARVAELSHHVAELGGRAAGLPENMVIEVHPSELELRADAALAAARSAGGAAPVEVSAASP